MKLKNRKIRKGRSRKGKVMGIIVTPRIYTIGETLKQIRESHNCTQKYIAQMIGVEEMTVHYYEHNKRAIRDKRAEDMRSVLRDSYFIL